VLLYKAMREVKNEDRLKALSSCRVYKAVADDCESSLGAVATRSVACTRSTRSDESVQGCGHT
jgi:hypothetical protein